MPAADLFTPRLEVLLQRESDKALMTGAALALAHSDEALAAQAMSGNLPKDRVRQVAEAELQRQLAPGDLYSIRGPSVLLTCFIEPDTAGAERKAHLVSQLKGEVLVEELPSAQDKVKPEHFVGSLDRSSQKHASGNLLDPFLWAPTTQDVRWASGSR